MANRTTSNEILSAVAIATMLVSAATLTMLMSPVSAETFQSTGHSGGGDGGGPGGGGDGGGSTGPSISIPTNTTQLSSCSTAGSSSPISASCNNNSTNNVDNLGGVLQ
ncbi:MAG TPA: hypothetical protein VH796_08890 [Nitrososphaeraceae archaeon]